MDLDYWGFRRWPFERSFAADRFFFSPGHEEALARLLFLIEDFRRTGIVIGPSGTGKTYLLKILQQRAERLGRLTVRCDATGLDAHELVQQIANGCLACCDRDESLARIWSGVQARFAALTLIQQPIVILLDHFDSVERSCHQVVCRLRQLGDSIGLNLTIVLGTCQRAIPAGLQEVVELRIDVVPWTVDENSQFITTSIKQAGVSKRLFTDEAMNSIHRHTKGVPANTVALCNLTLLAAMVRDEKLITSDLVDAVACEMPSQSVDRLLLRKASAVDFHLALTH